MAFSHRIIAFTTIALITFIIANLIPYSLAQSIDEEYNLGDTVIVNLENLEEFKIKMITPSNTYFFEGSRESFVFKPEELGQYNLIISEGDNTRNINFLVNGIEESNEPIQLDQNIEDYEPEYEEYSEEEPLIKLNEPVEWSVNFENPGNEIEITSKAENIKVNKIINGERLEVDYEIKNNVFRNTLSRILSLNEDFGTSSIILENNIQNIEVVYETGAPIKEEKSISNSAKEVVISSPPGTHYNNVLAYANLPKEVRFPSEVRIIWKDEGRRLDFDLKDNDNNGLFDEILWVAPHLSTQTFEIIVITKADHLDSNRNPLDDIYQEVVDRDDIWKEIPQDDFVRVTFEKNLTQNNDITIYARSSNPGATVEIYEKDSTTKIAEFGEILENKKYKVYLNNLIGEQDTFDLKIIGGSIEFDQIIDPTEITIDDDIEDATDEYGSGASVVFINSTRGYVFYIDNSGSGQPAYRTTNNSGQTWSNPTNLSSQTDVFSISVWYDQWTPGNITGTDIHIAFAETSTDSYFYERLDTEDDSQLGEVDISGDIGRLRVNDQAPSIVKSTANYLFVSGGGDQPAGDGPNIWKSIDNGASWGATNPSFNDDDDDEFLLMPLAGDDIMAIYINATNISSRIYDEGTDSWDASDTTIDENDFRPGGNQYTNSWSATLHKGTNDIFLIGNSRPNNGNADIRPYVYNGTDWINRSYLRTNIGTYGGDVAISLDENTGDLYTIFIEGGATNDDTNAIHYQVSTDNMTTWSDKISIDSDDGDFQHLGPSLFFTDILYTTFFENDLNDLLGITVYDSSAPAEETNGTISGNIFSNYSVTSIDVSPINYDEFILAWCDDTFDDIIVSVYNASTLQGPTQIVDSTAGNCFANSVGHSVSVSALNKSTFVIGWFDEQSLDMSFQIFDSDLINRTDVFDVDTDVGSSAAVSVSAFNETAFVIAWYDDDETLMEARTYDNQGNSISSLLTVDTDSDGNPSNIKASAFNHTSFGVAWFDSAGNDISYRAYTSGGNEITSGVVDIDSNAGESRAVDITAMNETTFIVAWQDLNSLNSTFSYHYFTGTQIGSDVEFHLNITGSPRAISVAKTSNEDFAVSWWDNNIDVGLSTQTFYTNGSQISSEVLVQNNSLRYHAIASEDTATEIQLCGNAYVVALANTTQNALFELYYPNGTVWDGTCPSYFPSFSSVNNFSVLEPSVPISINATITWLTDYESNSSVNLGNTTSLGTNLGSKVEVFNHSILFTGLEINTTYYYNITSCIDGKCNSSGTYNFTTPFFDLTEPTITIETVSNTTYTRSYFDFNVSLDESSDWCGLTIGSYHNVSMQQINTTYFHLPKEYVREGNVLANISCNDTFNNFAFTGINFHVNITTPYSVTRGVETLSTTSDTISESFADPSKAFILHTIRTSNDAPDDHTIITRPVNNESISVTRYDNDGTQALSWELIQTPDLYVQRGNFTYNSTDYSTTALIESINTSESFILIENSLDTGTRQNHVQGYWRASIVNETLISLERNISGTSGEVAWQVIEWNGASVQSGTAQADTVTTTSSAINEVYLPFTFPIAHYTVTNATNQNNDLNIQVRLPNSTAIEFERRDDVGILDIRWYVIELNKLDSNYGNYYIGATTSPENATITEVNQTSMTFTVNSFDTSAGNRPARSLMTQTLVNTTTIEFQKGNANNDGNISFFTVELLEDPDLTPPNGTLLSPANATLTLNTSFNFTVNITEDRELREAILNIYNSTNDIVNQTSVSVSGTEALIGIVYNFLYDGIFTWFYQIYDAANNVFATENNTIIINAQPPVQNLFECEESGLWQSCSNIDFGDNLTRVRVNCTDEDIVVNATLNLTNIPDSYTFFAANATSNISDNWIFDNPDIIINDSGEFRLEATCYGNGSGSNTSYSNWTVQWGEIIIDLINPTTNVDVTKDQFFNFTVNVTCLNRECGDLNVSLDPPEDGLFLMFNDTLTDSNGLLTGHTPETGLSWNEIYSLAGSSLQINSNVLDATNGNSDGAVAYANISRNWGKNQLVSVEYSTQSGGDNTAHIYVRADSDLSNAYAFRWSTASARTNLWKVVNGTVTELNASCGADSQFTTGDRVSLKITENFLEVFDGDTLVCSATDSDIERGQPGVGLGGNLFRNADDVNAQRLDDIRLYHLEEKFSLIPEGSGFPFYTISSNPTDYVNNSCLGDMKNNKTCEITWFINATGEINVPHVFFAFANSTNYSSYVTQNSSSRINITILSETIPPNGTLISPENNSIVLNATQNFTVNATDQTDLANATLFIYNESLDLVNQTTILTSGTEALLGIVYTFISDGIFTWFYEIFDSANNLFATNNNTIIVNALPPLNNLYECEASNSWQPCNNISFGQTITGIRVNCTDEDIIQNVTFNFTNIPDGSNFVYSNASYNISDLWIYNETNILINDSGEFRIDTMCIGNSSGINSSYTNWTVPWGNLSVSLISPVSNTRVRQGLFFDFEVNVSCIGGECGTANVSLDPPEDGMQLVFNDTFTDSNGLLSGHTPDLGFNWVEIFTIGGSNLQINSNQLDATAGGNDGAVSVANISQDWGTNQLVTAEYSAQDTGDDHVHFVLRADDSMDNAYVFSFSVTAVDTYIWKRSNGSTNTQLNTSCGADNQFVAGDTVSFKITDSLIEVFEDDTVICTASDSEISSGRPGVGLGRSYIDTNADVSAQRVDNLRIYHVEEKLALVPMGSGIPFYTTSLNPTDYNNNSCLSNLTSGESCLVDWSVNATGTLDLTHEFFAFANATFYSSYVETAESNRVNITISNDTSPEVTIAFPQELNYTVNISSINYTAIAQLGTTIDSCWYSTNQGVTNISITCGNNITNISNQDGNYTWNVYSNNTLGEIGTGSVYFLTDTTAPNATVIEPLNYTASLNSTANLTVNITDQFGIDNATLFVYNQSNDLINQTFIEVSGTEALLGIVYDFISNGFYTWFYEVIDIFGNIGYSENTTFIQAAPGDLQISLINPTTNANVNPGEFFTFTAQITCLNGPCGNVNATLDPENWWDSDWSFRKSFHVNSSSDGALTDYQKKIVVNYGNGSDDDLNMYCDSSCESDFSDIRFTNGTGIELDSYLVIKNDSDRAVFFVELDNIAASNGSDFYVYYGNSNVNTSSNGTATFDEFESWDDISSSTIDTAGSSGITFVQNSSNFIEGSASAHSDNPSQGYRIEMQNDNSYDIDDYVAEGWLYIGPDSGGNENFGPGIQIAGTGGANTGYQAIIDERSAQSPQVREDTSNSGRTNGDFQVLDETWYLVNIFRDGGSSVSSELWTESQVYGASPQTTTVRASETTYNSGFTGVFAYSQDNSGFDAVWVRKRTENEPTYGTWGAEEVNTLKGGIIPMNSGEPFYTITENPNSFQNTSCLENMGLGASCNVTWIVNATGAEGTTWEFFVYGNSTNYSETQGISSRINITISNLPPIAPELNFPVNNSAFSVFTEFNWSNSTDPTGDSIEYILQISNTTDFSIINYANYSIPETEDPTGDTPTGIIEQGTYYWRVLATDLKANSSWSEVRNFTFDNTAPNVTLLYPPNNTLNTTTNTQVFTYNVNDLTNVSSCSLIVNDIANTTDTSIIRGINQSIQAFLPNGIYTWSINCTDQVGLIGSSETRILNLTVADNPPTANEITCEEDSSGNYTSCNYITFGDTLTGVRVRCTDPEEGMSNVTFNLTNDPDGTNYFINSTEDNTGDFWTLNVPDTFINDSGNFSLVATCIDSTSFQGSNTSTWLAPWGSPEVTLLDPSSNTNVMQYLFFNFTANISCVGGECSDVNATLDPVGWWNTSWGKRSEISITNVGSSSLSDFPAFINITYDSDMNSDYSDLRFINSSCADSGSGSELSFEIENYTSSEALAWVKIPELTNSTTQICMYYQNSTPVTSTENILDVWSNGYANVQHLQETSGTHVDSSGNINATNSGSDQSASGIVDGANDFQDSESVILSSFGGLNSEENISISYWANQDTTTTNDYSIWANGNVLIQHGDSFNVPGATNLRVRWNLEGNWRNSHTATGILDTGTWHHWHFRLSDGNTTIFRDGAIVYSGTDSQTAISSSSPDLNIGFRSGSGGFDGIIDELRISEAFRSDNWVNQTYQMINDQSSFVSFSAEEKNKDGAVSTIVGDTPFYTTSQNPLSYTNASCLSNMRPGDSCEVSWEVNATGNLNTVWEFFVISTIANYSEWNPGGNESSRINLTIVNQLAPTVPILDSPANQTTLEDAPILNWTNSTDVNEDAIFYYLEVSNFSNFSVLEYVNQSIAEQTGPTGDTPSITSDGTYYWRVLATDLISNSSWSEVRYFIIDNSAPIITFINQTGEDGIIVNDSHPLDEGENLTISVDVTDVEVEAVWIVIWQTVKGGTELLRIFFEFVSGTLYQAVIPTNVSWGTDVNYTIYANDTAGQESEIDGNFTILKGTASIDINPTTVNTSQSVTAFGSLNLTNGSIIGGHPINLWIDGTLLLLANLTAEGTYDNYLEFNDTSSDGFNSGEYTNTTTDGTSIRLANNTAQGNFTRILDAGARVEWNNIVWSSVGASCSATVSFQDGDSNNYLGTEDAYIDSAASSTNYGSETGLLVDGSPSSQRAVIRFGNIIGKGLGQIPANSTISGANMTVEVSDLGNLVNVYEILENWTESEITYDDRITSTTWSSSGISGAPSRSTTLEDSFTPSATGSYPINVENAVRRWVNGTSNNYGLVFDLPTSNGINIRSSEYSTQSERPLLTVQYSSTDCTELTVYIRTSNDKSSWTSWQEVNSGDEIIDSNVASRYLEYRVDMSATSTSQTPILEEIFVNYTAVVTNSSGDYRYNFTNPSGFGVYSINVTSGLRTITLNDSVNLTVEAGLAPNVTLVSPNNSYWFSSENITLFYNATDSNNNLESATLIINGVPNITNTSTVNNGILSNITVNLTSGFYNWTISANDTTGFTGQATPTRNFYVDLEDPEITLIYPQNNSNFSVGELNLSYNVTDNLDSELSCDVILDEVTIETNVSSPSGSYTNVSSGALSDGPYEWRVVCFDEANRSVTSTTFNFVIIDIPPTVELIYPENNYLDSDGNISFVFNASDPTAVVNATLIINGNLDTLNQTAINNSQNTTINRTGLIEGAYNWTVIVYDISANSDQAIPWNFTVDLNPPEINLAAPDNGTTLNYSDVNFNFTVIDAIDTSLSCDLYVGDVQDLGFTAANNTLTNRLISDLTDGLKYWNVTCVDDSGHTNSSVTREITIAEPPVVTLDTPNQTSFSSQPFNLSYTATDNTNLSSCDLHINTVYNQTNSSAVINGIQQNFSVEGLSDGDYIWSVNCTDFVGASFQADELSFTVDTGAPNITLLYPNGDEIGTNNITFNYTASDTSDLTFTCNITVDTTIVDSAVVNNGSIYNATISGITDGFHTWNVTCIDSADNIGFSETYNFTKSTPPAVSLITPNDTVWINSSDFSLIYYPLDDEGFLESALYINGIINRTNNSAVISDQTNNFSITNFPDGNYNWTVRVTDFRGLNTTASPNRTFYVDTQSPQLTLNNPLNNTLVSTNNVTFNFTVSDNLDQEISCNFYLDGEIEYSDNSTSGLDVVNYVIVNDGDHEWNVTCIDEAENINISQIFNFTVEAPPNVTLVTPNNSEYFNDTSTTFIYLPEDPIGINNCSLIIDDSYNSSSSSINANVNNNFTVSGISEGVHNWTVECTDAAPDLNPYRPPVRNFTVDRTEPNVTLNNPTNGEITLPEVVFNFSVVDNLDDTLVCNLYIDGALNVSSINVANNSNSENSVTGLSVGTHTWNVSCIDNSSNIDWSETWSFDVFLADLEVNSTDIALNNSSPTENETITINATIRNLVDATTYNITIQFYDDDPSTTGQQIGSNQTISSIAGLGSETVEVEWTADLGTSQIYVLIDPPLDTNGSIVESNEINNEANLSVTIGSWHFVVGDIDSLSEFQLADPTNNSVIRWSAANFQGGNIFVADSESSITWSSVQAIGRNTSGDLASNDISEIDTLLNMTSFTDSFNELYINSSGDLYSISDYILFNRQVNDIPVTNSTNNTNFLTGILWDAADDSDGEFDTTEKEDLILHTVINKDQTGAYGDYDYEIRIAAKLREYFTADSRRVVFYTELR